MAISRVLGQAFAGAISLLALLAPAQAQQCKGTVYLTLDTGNMREAETIAQILAKHQVKITFFMANEQSWPDRNNSALEPAWTNYWRARVAEGHAFGSHTWRHGLFSKDQSDAKVSYRPQFGAQAGQTLALDADQVCRELRQVDDVFHQMTGQHLDPIWRAPGGRTTPFTIKSAKACGYSHVHWAAAGFLGDELPSEKFPNELLLSRALRDIRDQDILMGHLGIWSRKERFVHVFEPLVTGLKERGFCFSTLRDHPQFKRKTS
jgi:peptidoglycan/xylan/chitin deacetylase (PgdA/CDA1 family)